MKSLQIHKNLKAFTLLELLIGMILSGIVLTTTFSAYRIITKQYESYKTHSESASELSSFISQFQSDFSHANEAVQINENTIQLQNENRSLEYTFSEKRVLRNDFMRVDTLSVFVSNIETFRNAQKLETERNTFNEIRMNLLFEGKRIQKIYFKNEDAKTEIDKAESEMTQHGN